MEDCALLKKRENKSDFNITGNVHMCSRKGRNILVSLRNVKVEKKDINNKQKNNRCILHTGAVWVFSDTAC